MVKALKEYIDLDLDIYLTLGGSVRRCKGYGIDPVSSLTIAKYDDAIVL